MPTQLLTGAAANTTSDPIDPTGHNGRVMVATLQVLGTLDGAVVRAALSPTGSANTYQILTSSTVESSTGPLNVEYAGGYYLAFVLTGASTSTSVDAWAAVGVYGADA